MTPRRPAAALSHHQTAELTDRLGSAATSILDSSAALIDPTLAPPCSLLQSYSTQGSYHILALCVYICSRVFVSLHFSAKKTRNKNCCDEMCKY